MVIENKTRSLSYAERVKRERAQFFRDIRDVLDRSEAADSIWETEPTPITTKEAKDAAAMLGKVLNVGLFVNFAWYYLLDPEKESSEKR